jgi:hypothetical protein
LEFEGLKNFESFENKIVLNGQDKEEPNRIQLKKKISNEIIILLNFNQKVAHVCDLRDKNNNCNEK